MGVFGLDTYCREKEVGSLVAFTATTPCTVVVDLSNVMHTLAKRCDVSVGGDDD